jgi:hypothetical protein
VMFGTMILLIWFSIYRFNRIQAWGRKPHPQSLSFRERGQTIELLWTLVIKHFNCSSGLELFSVNVEEQKVWTTFYSTVHLHMERDKRVRSKRRL